LAYSWEPDVPKHYTVSDGDLVLFLWPAEEGGYNVTSPLDPALITQAETVEEAFEMARDAREVLDLARIVDLPEEIKNSGRPKSSKRPSKGRRTSAS
jgi:antitoxin HicB